MSEYLIFIAFVIGGALLGLIWAQSYQLKLKWPKQRVWLFPALIGAVAGFVAWLIWRL